MMKPALPSFPVPSLAALLCCAATAWGGVHMFHFSNLNLGIPDGSSAGVSVTRQLSLPPDPIASVRVSLGVLPRDGSPAFNGDFYAALTHGSGYTVLLNRVGRRDGSVLGYGDGGFNVTFDDAASLGDIHQYRLELNGSHTTRLEPAGSSLGGAWAPDGRDVSPMAVMLSDQRTALLSTFTGMDANGDWTLLVADWESGGVAKLDRWALEITLVPEPVATGAVAGIGLLALAMFRKRARASVS